MNPRKQSPTQEEETVERRQDMKEFRVLLQDLVRAVQGVEVRLGVFENVQKTTEATMAVNTLWINGNGKKGAKSMIESHESKIRMLFVIGGTLAGAVIALMGTVAAGLIVAWILYTTHLSSAIPGAIRHLVIHIH